MRLEDVKLYESSPTEEACHKFVKACAAFGIIQLSLWERVVMGLSFKEEQLSKYVQP